MKRGKILKQMTAMAVFGSMVASTAFSGISASNVKAADPVENEWQQIQSIVGRYYGEWNTPMEPMDGSREGIDMPNTALLGNGDVGVASGGNEDEKKFYFSKGDFWAYGPSTGLHEPGMMAIGGVTIGQSREGIISIEAEDYVQAGDVVIGGGVGYIDNGDWMEYTVSIDKPGTYKLNYRVAVNKAPGKVEFVANGNSLATTDLPTTGGWANWKTVNDTVEFAEAGEYTVRLNVIQGGWNIDKFSLKLDNSLPEESDNLALNKPIKYCSAYTDGGVTHKGEWMVDGDISTKWCSLHDNESTHWAIVDLGEKKNISYYRIIHSGIVGETQHNTVDYQLQYLDSEQEEWDTIEQIDEVLWKDMDVVTGNRSTETGKTFETPVNARYVRLLITNPAPGNKAARIHELELKEEVPFKYYEKQDILNAEIQTQQELAGIPTEMKTWLSSDENIMVTELKSNGNKAADFQVETWASDNQKNIRPISAENNEASVTVTRATEIRHEDEKDMWVSKAALSTKVIGADEVTAKSNNDTGKGTLTFTLEPKQTVYIVTAVGGGGRTYTNTGDLWEGAIEPKEDAAKLLAGVPNEAAVSDLNDARQDWWKDFWSTSYVDFGTEDANLNKIQKYYYGAQYILGSSSKEGKTAPGLYGIWRTNDKPGFRGDYHLNYNFIASFYGTNSSNRPEFSLSGVQALLDFVPDGQRRASSVEELRRINADFVNEKIAKGDIDPEKGIEGAILYPVGIGPHGTVTDDAYHNEALDAAYNSYLMTQYYDYTMDTEFLKNGVYDYMKQAVAFYEAWLEKENSNNNQDGYEYVLYAGYNEGTWAKNPAVELAALKNTLRNLIKFSEDLGRDADKRAKWIDIYEHLGDQPTTVVNGKTVLALGEKQWNGSAWVDLPSPIPGDGNAIPLDAMIPGGVYNYFSSPEDLQMVRDTIDVFSARGAWGQINNFSRLFPEAVKSRYPINTIVTKLVAVINSQMASNLRINDNTHGLEKSGSTETINSMMLITEDGITKIFPNWYTDKDAKFAHLRAKGAFTVSAEYDGAAQEAKKVTITSEAGEDMTLVSPWEEGMTVKDSSGKIVQTTKGTVPNWEEEENATYTFATTVGETYTVEKGNTGEPSKDISLGIYGDSFTVNGVGAQKAFGTLVAEDLEAKVYNYGVSGSVVQDGWKKLISDSAIPAAPHDIYLINLGYNDVRNYGNQEKSEDEIACRLKAMISYLRLGNIIDDTDPTLQYSGGWIPFGNNVASGSGLKYTGTPGASVKFTHTGDKLTIGSFVLKTDGGTMKITVDGTVKFEQKMEGCAAGYANTSIELTGLGEGTHEVEISKSDSGNGYIYLDYVGTPSEELPEIYVDSITYMREDQYSNFGPSWNKGSKEAADRANRSIREMIDGFDSKVIFVDQSSFDPNQDSKLLCEDNVHPNEYGHRVMADNVLKAMDNGDALEKEKLQKLYDDNKDRVKEGYTEECWKNFEKALENAKNVLENATTQEEIDDAEMMLQTAIDNLRVSKKSLEYFLNKAKEHKANGDVDGCVDSAKKLFDEAIAEGEAVMADENATYEEVQNASLKLMLAIQALDMKAADKTDLIMSIDLADGIDLSKYVEAGQAEFIDALAKAKEVLADGDAFQPEADDAWNALVDAMCELRLKANKSNLEDLLNSVKDLDLSKYTEESVAAFRVALAKAEEVMADEALSEDDEEVVNDAVKALADAKEQLESKDDTSVADKDDEDKDGNNNGEQNGGSGDGNTGNVDDQKTGNGDNKTNAPKTGDMAMPFVMLMMVVLTGGIVIGSFRRKHNK